MIRNGQRRTSPASGSSWRRAWLLWLGLFAALPVAAQRPPPGAVCALEFLDDTIYPVGQRYQGWQIDGLSGLDYDPRSQRFIAVRDNAIAGGGGAGLPPYFRLRPRFSPQRRGYRLVLDGVTPLRLHDATGVAVQGFESIRFDPRGDGIWLTSEAPHGLHHLHADGRQQTLSLPAKVIGRFAAGSDNYGLEGLSFSPSGRLWLARENALDGDSPNLIRLSRLDRHGTLQAQYSYRLDAVVASANGGRMIANPPGRGVGNNGVSELLALDETHLLVMERAWDGIGAAHGDDRVAHTHIRIYRVDTADATDVKDVDQLALDRPGQAPLAKTLVFDSVWLARRLGSYDHKIDNLEGMSLGPRLTNGEATLVLVSDSNNRWQQRKTQLLVLRVVSSGCAQP